MDTCKIDGQIEEIRRLLAKTLNQKNELTYRLDELLREKERMVEEEPIKIIREALRNASGIKYCMNGKDSPQIEFAGDNVSVYNYELKPIIPYPIRGIEVKDGVIRICFNSSSKLS